MPVVFAAPMSTSSTALSPVSTANNHRSRYSGTVVEVGSDVREIKVGDRVTVDPSFAWFATTVGRDRSIFANRVFRGAYAEYTTVPERVV